MKHEFHRFMCFAGVGAIGTLLHFGILVALVQGLGIDAVFASTVGYVVGAFVNYTLNYRYTFASNKGHREAMVKFFSVAAVGMFLNGSFVSFGVEFIGAHYLLAQIVATGLVLLWNYGANRMWTFRHQECDIKE